MSYDSHEMYQRMPKDSRGYHNMMNDGALKNAWSMYCQRLCVVVAAQRPRYIESRYCVTDMLSVMLHAFSNILSTHCLHICCTISTTTSIVLTSGINKTTPDDNNRFYMLSVFSRGWESSDRSTSHECKWTTTHKMPMRFCPKWTNPFSQILLAVSRLSSGALHEPHIVTVT